MRYFKKINLQNTLKSGGNLVNFMPIADGNGVIELDDEKDRVLISDIDTHADARRLGVVRISKEIYEAQLKKKASLKSRNPSNQLRIQKPIDPFHKDQSPAPRVVEGKKPEPDLTPELPPSFSQFRERTRKSNAAERTQK